jgi:hypothetical protein
MKTSILAISLAFAFGTSLLAQGPASEELQVLAYAVGNWQIVTEDDPESKATSTGVWVLGGQFLQISWSRQSKDAISESGIQMLTYDPVEKVYSNIAFSHTGYTARSTGIWNPQTKTMVWTARHDDGTYTITRNTFVDARKPTWSIVTIDQSGKLVQESSGTLHPM